MPQPRADGAAQSGGNERFGNFANPVGARTIGLAQRNTVALDVLDHSRRSNLGRKINDGPNHSSRLDGGCNPSAGIDALQAQSIPFPAKTLEIPPWNAILH